MKDFLFGSCCRPKLNFENFPSSFGRVLPFGALIGVFGTKRKTREGREKKKLVTIPSRVAPKTPMSAQITPFVEATYHGILNELLHQLVLMYYN